jgi:hypothetical protein
MFGKDNNAKTTQNKDAQNNTPAPAANPRPDSAGEIYVMPEKFHEQKTQGSSNKTLMISVIVLVLIVVSSGTYFFYNMLQQNKDNDSNSNANVNTNQVAQINSNNANRINRNTNRDTNGNLNTNTNENTNGNLNINNNNSNANDNANANDNSNTNSNTNVPVIPIPSGDADRDGLTDLEESLIGSSASSPDSDQDGYLDGEEVAAGYNPVVATAEGQPFTLLEADFIDRLETSFTTNNFTTIYIKGWSVNFIDALHEARIITGTGEMIKISVLDNPENISATNWYLLNNTNVSLSQLDNIELDGFKGIYSPDHLSAYLVDDSKNKFYVLEYDLDNRAEFRYPTVFDMVINNFELLPDLDPDPLGENGDPTES